MLKGQKAVSLCWVRPAMEKELMKEMDGSIGRERTCWVSSEEKTGGGVTAGERPCSLKVNLVWLRSQKENGHLVEKRGTENGLT